MFEYQVLSRSSRNDRAGIALYKLQDHLARIQI